MAAKRNNVWADYNWEDREHTFIRIDDISGLSEIAPTGKNASKRAAAIAAKFKPAAFGLATVWRDRRGRIWLIVGWKRVEALRILGIKTVPCVVVECGSLEDAADIRFKVKMTTTKMTTCDEIRTGAAAKVPLYVDLLAVLSKHGIHAKLHTGDRTKMPRVFDAELLKASLAIVKHYHDAGALDKALTLMEAFADRTPAAKYHCTVNHGHWLWALAYYTQHLKAGDVSLATVYAKLRGSDPARIEDAAERSIVPVLSRCDEREYKMVKLACQIELAAKGHYRATGEFRFRESTRSFVVV